MNKYQLLQIKLQITIQKKNTFEVILTMTQKQFSNKA